MYKSAPEGYPFIAGSLILTVLALLIFPHLAVIPFVIFLFMLYFFRDPERTIPGQANLFVSPADGKVIVIRDVYENVHLQSDTKQISIFMSPFNVHVNRSPSSGKVTRVQHSKGRFLAAYRDEASLRNEKIEMVLETPHGKILVRQVAGFVARRAVCRKKPGDELLRGERYGIIKFSSRLDIYLPNSVAVKVQLNEDVKAGETVIAEMPDVQ